MSGRSLALIGLVFLATRLGMLYYVENPDSYPLANAPFTADVDVPFHNAAVEITGGSEPYTDFDLEYPPGIVPFLVMPEHSWPQLGDYRSSFAKLMMLVDIAGLIAIVVLASRWGSLLGPWMWVGLIALMGPLVYVRFDLVPAVATAWAVVGASSARWGASGGWLGYGAMTKIYPGFLLPLTLVASTRQLRLRVLMMFAGIAAATAAVVIVLVGGSPGEIYGDAFASRTGSGVHLETTWGSFLLIADRLGYTSHVESYLSTFYFQGGAARVLEPVALILTVVAVIAGAYLVRNREEDGGRTFAMASFATLALVLGLSTTFSPQFVIWLIPVAAAALCIHESPLGWIPWLLVPVATMTQFLYPYQYHRILDRDWLGLGVLAGRNLLILVTGILVLVKLGRSQARAAGMRQAINQ